MIENALKCPYCDFDYLHIVSITVHRGTDKTIIDNKGVFVKEEKNKNRGVTLTVEFYCESGHHFNTVLQFHKGATLMEHEKLEDLKAEHGLADLWRC